MNLKRPRIVRPLLLAAANAIVLTSGLALGGCAGSPVEQSDQQQSAGGSAGQPDPGYALDADYDIDNWVYEANEEFIDGVSGTSGTPGVLNVEKVGTRFVIRLVCDGGGGVDFSLDFKGQPSNSFSGSCDGVPFMQTWVDVEPPTKIAYTWSGKPTKWGITLANETVSDEPES